MKTGVILSPAQNWSFLNLLKFLKILFIFSHKIFKIKKLYTILSSFYFFHPNRENLNQKTMLKMKFNSKNFNAEMGRQWLQNLIIIS